VNEFALFACGDYQASAFLLQISHEICVGKFPCAFTDLSSGQVWLTKNIEIVGFDNQMAFAACAAFVATTLHERSLAQRVKKSLTKSKEILLSGRNCV